LQQHVLDAQNALEQLVSASNALSGKSSQHLTHVKAHALLAPMRIRTTSVEVNHIQFHFFLGFNQSINKLQIVIQDV
jgi:hypothetical protein